MKINLLIKIARQVEGERIYINVVKASSDKDKIHNYLKSIEIPATEEIDGMGCVVELGVLEDVEVDV